MSISYLSIKSRLKRRQLCSGIILNGYQLVYKTASKDEVRKDGEKLVFVMGDSFVSEAAPIEAKKVRFETGDDKIEEALDEMLHLCFRVLI